MITTLPYSTAEIISTTAPRKFAGKGIVEKKLEDGVYVISLPAGKVTVKVTSGTLSEGDQVSVSRRGNELVLQKTPFPENSPVPLLKDAVEVRLQAGPAPLKYLVDTVVEQLRDRVLDKQTLDQLQKIIAAVAKSPQSFGEDIQNAVGDLKKIVSLALSAESEVPQFASEITNRIIALGETLRLQLKVSGGAVDVVLKSEARLKEGYYKFDSVKSAISWIAENKDVSAEIPWQKLSQTFKDGPVVLKVYESAIGDVRASLVSPEKVEKDLDHFAAGALKAEVWKGVGGRILMELLNDRKEIPLERLLELDKLLVFSGKVGTNAGLNSGKETAGYAPASKGFQAALGQWLAVALDNDAPVAEFVARAPSRFAQQLTELFTRIESAQKAAGVALVKTIVEDDYALQHSLVTSDEKPETVIPGLFRRLGLNLESALSQDNALLSFDPKGSNLKAMMLSFLSSLDSIAAPPPVVKGNAFETAPTPQPQAAGTNAKTHASFADRDARSSLLRGTQLFIQEIIDKTAGKIVDLLKMVQHDADGLPREIAGLSQATVRQGSSAPQEKGDIPAYLLKLSVKLQALAVSLINGSGAAMEEMALAIKKSIEEFPAPPAIRDSSTAVLFISSEKSGPADPADPGMRQVTGAPGGAQKEDVRLAVDLVSGAARRIAAKVKEVSEAVQDLLKTVVAGHDRLSAEKTALALGSGRQGVLDAFTKDLVKDLLALGRFVANAADQASREVALRLDDLAAQTAKLTDKIVQNADRPQERGPLDTLKQHVEQILNRVESLQMLAKQVSLSDSQQQVISVPMKIEGQMTDVVIKFIKKKEHSEKEEAKKNVSVVIHVAPELLGEITVFMEYREKKNFAMRMEFEKPESRQWFEVNREPFSKAIEKIGFAALTIDMRELSRRQSVETMVENGGDTAGKIDVKA
jgi:hypothetical protein